MSLVARYSIFVLFVTSIAAAEAPRDYEASVAKLYPNAAEMLEAWPVEFHIRIVEGLCQDIVRAWEDGAALDGYFAPKVSFGWGKARAAWKLHPPKTVGATGIAAELRVFREQYQQAQLTLKPKDGKVPGPGRFLAKVFFEVRGHSKDGRVRDTGTLAMSFVKTKDGWRVDGWRLLQATRTQATQARFRPATDMWLRHVPAAVRERLLVRSASDEAFHRLARPVPGAVVSPVAMDAHPGIAVVDVDGDGYDDIYTWDVMGPADLLLNRAADNGRVFVEATTTFGLDAANLSSAVFADLNNDGTTDVVLGRWHGPSEVRLGQATDAGVVFVPHRVVREGALPSRVAAVALADINQDGRLDMFFATASQDVHQERARENTLPAGADLSVSQIGPRNVFLVSENGTWTDKTDAWGLALERNSLAPAFADYDGDGDVDLFLGNDFAPATMYENTGQRFRDVSAETGADRIYYGMGASWGDIDGDGDLDLYASAMSSSAGKRILANEEHFSKKLSKADRRARHDARRGSTLLLNAGGGRFRDGTKDPMYAALRNGNWSYGSIFIDADNDGQLEVYAPNGFFTSPWVTAGETIRDL